jgi:hypothetical protein
MLNPSLLDSIVLPSCLISSCSSLQFSSVQHCLLSYFSLCSDCRDRRDYFSAPKVGKEQPDKAERKNTLTAVNGEEDFSGSPLRRSAGIVRIVTDGYFRSKITLPRSHG